MDPGYAGPVIDTFMRALPQTLRNVTAPERTALQMTVTGPGACRPPLPAGVGQRRLR